MLLKQRALLQNDKTVLFFSPKKMLSSLSREKLQGHLKK